MLGVFRRDLKELDKFAPVLPDQSYIPALKEGLLERFLADYYRQPTIVGLGTCGFIAYSADKNISPSPRPKFFMQDGIYCIHRGGTKVREKRKKAGKGKGWSEVDNLIACYEDLKRNGYKTPFEAIPVFTGDYNYILFDSFVGVDGATRGAFVVNCWEDMPVYYGLDSYGVCVITDDLDIIQVVCMESFKSIPTGNGLFIPVLVEIKQEPNEADPSGGSSSSVVEASKGNPIEGKYRGGSSSKKTSGGKAVEASPSGGSSIIIKESGGEAFGVAVSPSGGSSSKKGSGEKRNADRPPGGSSPKKGRG